MQDLEVDDLRELAAEYPYSQVIQLLYGLRLRYSSGHLFNQQLGRAAALSNDRSVLFDLFENKAKPIPEPTTLSVVNEEEELVEESPAAEIEENPQVEQEDSNEVNEEDQAPEPVAEEAEIETEELPEEEPEELKVKEDTVVAEAISPQIVKPEEPEEPEEDQKSEKTIEDQKSIKDIEVVPEDISDLSPQDRVKAILERNKAIRDQFEQERKGESNEKLFSGPNDENAEQTASKEDAPVKENLDAPIDIAAMVKRRYEAQYGSLDDYEEEDLETKSEASAQEEVTEPENTIEEEPAADPNDSGDIALSTRIRIIRDRLEALKDSNALSSEEMGALMEEHNRLESLMSELPIDEEHVFDVELDEEQETAEAKEDSVDQSVETPAPAEEEETKAEQETSEPIEATEAEPELSEDEKLDAEIRRVEELASRMRSDSSSRLNLNKLNEIREEQLRKLEEEAKNSAPEEEAKPEVEAEQPPVQNGEVANERELEQPEGEQPEAEAIEAKEEDQKVEESPSDLQMESSQDEEPEASSMESEMETTAEEEFIPEPVETEESEAVEDEVTINLEDVPADSNEDVEPSPSIDIDEELDFVPSPGESPELDPDLEELTFSDWLKRIRKGDTPDMEEPRQSIKAKVDLLDSFVEKLPELKQKSRLGQIDKPMGVGNPKPNREESEGLGMVTETLAKVYIRQKHYKKAIQAYEILKLKYPEKSTFFASQILEIKKLAKSN